MGKPEFLILENPKEFKSLDAITADKFEEVDRKILPLLEKIIHPFADINKKRTGYTNTNRPKEEAIDEYKYGVVNISIKTVPTTLKTNYKAVVKETENFLNFVIKDYQEGRIRKGILTMDNQIYIGLDDVINKIQELKAKALEGKEGITQEVKPEAPVNIIKEGLEKVIYKLGKDYSAQTKENAADFARAKALKKAITDNFYSKFIDQLKERTGYSNDNLPSETVQEFVRVGRYLFPIQVIPKETTKYAKVVDTFIKPYNKKITANTGELIKLKEGIMDKELARYTPRMRQGKMFVLSETLKQRLSEVKTEYTKPGCSYKIERSIRIT